MHRRPPHAIFLGACAIKMSLYHPCSQRHWLHLMHEAYVTPFADSIDYEASVPEVTLPRQLHSSLHSKIPHGGFSSQLEHMQALPPYSLLCVPKLPQVKSPLTLYTCKPINSAGGDLQTYHAFKSHHGSDCATLQDSLNGCMLPSITMHTY